MLESISHIALIVRDPAKTAALFHDLFNARAGEIVDVGLRRLPPRATQRLTRLPWPSRRFDSC
jgi:hypothetical protein